MSGFAKGIRTEWVWSPFLFFVRSRKIDPHPRSSFPFFLKWGNYFPIRPITNKRKDH
jgi:hypothetical protein